METLRRKRMFFKFFGNVKRIHSIHSMTKTTQVQHNLHINMKDFKLSNLDLVEKCDSFPDPAIHPSIYKERTSQYAKFMHLSHLLSYIIPPVLEALKDVDLSGDWWAFHDNSIVTLKGDTFEERSNNIKKTVTKWRDTHRFEILEGWRNESYMVYAPTGKAIFQLERCASALFGVVTYGAHMMAYVPATATKPLRLWIPRRAGGKSTYPSMLDNTVAGGIGNGISAFECIVKEAGEEASLESDFVKQHIKSAGFISYFYERSKDAGGEVGLLQPEIQYVYDLELPEDVKPKPNDDEVEKHFLMTLDEVQAEMGRGKFKPNCALADNEPDYVEIYARIHRRFEFPTW